MRANTVNEANRAGEDRSRFRLGEGDPVERATPRARIVLATVQLLGALTLGAGVGAGAAAGAGGGTGADVVVAGRPMSHWVAEARAPARAGADRSALVAALVSALGDPSVEVRVLAGDALGALGKVARPAAAALVAQLDEESPWVRIAAMETLVGLRGDALPALVGGFKKMSMLGRVRIALVLQSIGAEAFPAADFLEAQARGDSAAIADRLDEVVAWLRGTAQPAADRRSGPAVAALDRPPPDKPDRDWPGFRGPRRDGVCAERGLLQEWPEGGPPLAWRIDGLGRGFSSVSITGGRLFTMGDRPGPDGLAQYLLCYDLDDRRELWSTRVGPPHSDGPRCTPETDGARVCALGTDGDLVCASVADGRVLWRRQLVREFGGRMMSIWKFSESPLIDGARVLCTPGGPEAALVALDARTGATLWKCAVPDLGARGRDGAGYASMVTATIGGGRQYVQLLGRGLVGVEADTGRFLWGYNAVANGTANIPSAVVCGNHVFTSTAYNTGSALLHLSRTGDAWRAREIYFAAPDILQNHHGGMVMVGRYLYAGHGSSKGAPTCLEVATGALMWKAEAPGRGSASVLYADGRLIFRYDRGPVYLIDATPERYRVRGGFDPLKGKGPAWAHPVIFGGRLLLRHGDVLAAYDVRAGTR